MKKYNSYKLVLEANENVDILQLLCRTNLFKKLMILVSKLKYLNIFIKTILASKLHFLKKNVINVQSVEVNFKSNII